MEQLQSVFGVVSLIGIAWLVSSDRRDAPWRFVAAALFVQVALAALLTQAPIVFEALRALSVAVEALQAASGEAASFVFGHIAGGPAPYEVVAPGAGLSIAFQILPIVIVTSALASLLWHWGVLSAATRALSWALRRSLGVSGAVGLGAAANVFLGVIEAPLFFRAFIARMTRSDLFAVLTVGLATVSGVVFVLYASTLAPIVPGAIAHILAASAMSLPAALLIARIMEPGPAHAESEEEASPASLRYDSAIDAVAQGAVDGLKLFLNIIAILIVVVAFVALADMALSQAPVVDGAPITVARLFGWAFAPLVWLFGVPWSEAETAGALMGTKVVLNEFFAYLELAALPEGALSPRSALIMLYAMCGFANLGSLGIMIVGFAALAPERRADVAALAPRAWIAGNLATGMTGAVIGAFTAVT